MKNESLLCFCEEERRLFAKKKEDFRFSLFLVSSFDTEVYFLYIYIYIYIYQIYL